MYTLEMDFVVLSDSWYCDAGKINAWDYTEKQRLGQPVNKD